jgi:hypothetical protein
MRRCGELRWSDKEKGREVLIPASGLQERHLIPLRQNGEIHEPGRRL